MYQAQITSNIDGQPAGADTAKAIGRLIGGHDVEPVDAEQGIWLITIDRFNAHRLERDGYLTMNVSGHTVEIELP